MGLGVAALVWPSVQANPWVGSSADELGAQVFGRALGARDLALGLGALTAARETSPGSRSAGAWYAAGALSDALDVAVTRGDVAAATAAHPVAGRRVRGRRGGRRRRGGACRLFGVT